MFSVFTYSSRADSEAFPILSSVSMPVMSDILFESPHPARSRRGIPAAPFRYVKHAISVGIARGQLT